MTDPEEGAFEVPIAVSGDQSYELAQLVAHAIRICQGDMPRLFELTIASPSLVMSLFLTTRFIINNSFGVPEPERIKTLRDIQADTVATMRKILQVIEADDPQAVLAAQVAEMKAKEAFDHATSKDVH